MVARFSVRILVVAALTATVLGLPRLAAAAEGVAPAPLVAAMKRQDAAAVRSLLRQKSNANAQDAEGMTALHWAAHHNDLSMVRTLLAAGAKATVANRYGVTALHEAAMRANVAMVTALLRAGAEADAAYGDGETPLMIAARVGSVEVVKALLERGAAVNGAEKFRGHTALMMAVTENHAEVVKTLLAAGAYAGGRTKEYVFQDLVGGAGGIIHDRPTGHLTPLILAARAGATAAGEALIVGGANLDSIEPQYQFSALQTAIFNGNYRFAKMLIEKGADVNDGSLYIAMEMRNLASYSNRPNPADSDGGVTHLDIAKLLLDKGANPNTAYWKTVPPRQAQGNINVPEGATPLYRAVRSVDLTAVKLLLERGANAGQPIYDGSTPLMAASGLGAPRGGDEEVKEAGDRNDPVDVLKALVDAGADVNAQSDNGMTGAHYAAQRGSDRIIQFLADKGAKLDVRNKQGRTPRDLARGRTAALLAQLTGAPAPALAPPAAAGAPQAAPAAPSQR